jgi:hypothetical protein
MARQKRNVESLELLCIPNPSQVWVVVCSWWFVSSLKMASPSR